MRKQFSLRQTWRVTLLSASLGIVLASALAGTASATGSTTGELNKPQPLSKADLNPGGANGQCPEGPYCSTRDGSASMNGNGGGEATGRPAAGAVGKADNKNPRGQMPNGSDNNSGYECDSNNGIGKGNPAHTGCTVTDIDVKDEVVKDEVVKDEVVKDEVVKDEVVKDEVVKDEDVTAVVTPGEVLPAVAFPGEILGAVVNAPVKATPAKATPRVVTPGVVTSAGVTSANPLPAFAAAGDADTSGQLALGGLAAFAGLLVAGAGFVLRRRLGDV